VASLAQYRLLELLGIELPAYNHLVELILELKLLDAKLLFEAFQDFGDLGSAGAAQIDHGYDQYCRLAFRWRRRRRRWWGWPLFDDGYLLDDLACLA